MVSTRFLSPTPFFFQDDEHWRSLKIKAGLGVKSLSQALTQRAFDTALRSRGSVRPPPTSFQWSEQHNNNKINVFKQHQERVHMAEHPGASRPTTGGHWIGGFDLKLVHVKAQNDLWPFNRWVNLDTHGGWLKNASRRRVSGLEMGAFPIPAHQRQWKVLRPIFFFRGLPMCLWAIMLSWQRYQTSLQFEIITIRGLLYLYYTVVTNNLKWCLTISSERAAQTQR